MINADGLTEEQIALFCELAEQGMITNEGKLTDKGRRELNSTRSFPILQRSKR